MSTSKLPAIEKTPQMLRIEAAYGGKDLRLILAAKIEADPNMTKIAAELDVSVATLYNWLPLLGLSIKRTVAIGEPVVA